MLVYRLSTPPYHLDLSGTGARIHGGRWNSEGVAMLYTSSSRALAALEVMAHTPVKLLRKIAFVLVEIEVPDDFRMETFSLMQLPEDWLRFPAPPALAQLGDGWIHGMKTEMLRVPCALMPEEHNYLINPSHPRADELKIKNQSRWLPDPRLMV